MLYRFLILGAIALLLLIGLIYGFTQHFSGQIKDLLGNDYKSYLVDIGSYQSKFALQDPEMAPPSIKPLVMQGYHIMLETKLYAPEYAGDRLNCTNCHFSGGNTLGEPGAGIPLVGVTKKYPRPLSNGREYTLEERINSCFAKSMNGKPIPENSQEMKALIAYFEWISKPVSELSHIPWLGLKELHSQHIPDLQRGSAIYAKYCALCHGRDGEGQKRGHDLSYPPLWGQHSFNDAAGMNKLPKFASFTYYNMPYEEPSSLTIEEALDVAAFVTQQPRPHSAYPKME